MRGTPFFQVIFMVAAFLLAGWPVYRLTRPGATVTATNASLADTTTSGASVKEMSLEVEVVCASAPTDLQIKCLDQTVLTGRGPRARFSNLWTTTLPPEGVDLVVQARWPAAGSAPAADGASGANPGAARVTVRLANGRQIEKSFWAAANGTMNEVFTVPGNVVETAP